MWWAGDQPLYSIRSEMSSPLPQLHVPTMKRTEWLTTLKNTNPYLKMNRWYLVMGWWSVSIHGIHLCCIPLFLSLLERRCIRSDLSWFLLEACGRNCSTRWKWPYRAEMCGWESMYDCYSGGKKIIVEVNRVGLWLALRGITINHCVDTWYHEEFKGNTFG